jgi:arylsulfatase
MDHGIGRLVDVLKRTGQATNTLLLFLSDNGADSFSVMDQPMLKAGKLPGDPGSNWQPGTGWAYASVTPWRLYKISQHAGGITTGAICWGPGQLGKPGRIESSPLHMIDVLPTFLELAQRARTDSSSASNAAAVAGESFAPLLKGGLRQRPSPRFFQYMDNRAIRTAEWALAEVDDAGWELFNTATDPLETRNLAAQHPQVVKDLSGRWLQWWREQSGKTDYLPKSTRTGPHYKPQGDRGTGVPYQPSAMPARLAGRLPVPP